MMRSFRSLVLVSALLTSLLLNACGGGSSASDSTTPTAAASSTVSTKLEPGAPSPTGNTATDGFNWFNYRRQQIGVQTLARNSVLDVAAQGHSNYQKLNGSITHVQTAGKPGFTGATLPDRLRAAGYQFTSSYAYGEVISSTSDTSGFQAADDLITAIYHRFVIFEPMFREAGAGAATVPNGYTYFTTDFTANGLTTGLGRGNFAIYPFASQQNIPTTFYSDYELPDPVPDRNEVGYPVSIHADITSTVAVQTFTIQPHGGAVMPVKLLTHAADAQTPNSAAAIIPMNVLAAATTYDVQFSGTIDGVAVSRSWSFKTR